MVRNTEKYEQAWQLRQRGFTLAEIAKYCAISKSTASEWLKNNAFSQEVTKQNTKRAGLLNAKRLQLISKARRAERSIKHAEIIRSAETEYRHYRKDPLFLAGLATYAALGDYSDRHVIRFSSNRIEVHIAIIRFMCEYLGVEKSQIRFWLLIPRDLDEAVCMKKWQKALRLPYSQFHKNQLTISNPTKKTLHNGTGNTIIGSTALKQKLNCWIKLYQKELIT